MFRAGENFFLGAVNIAKFQEYDKLENYMNC